MSVRESSFNRKLRTKLAHLGFKIDRIESHSTAPGIPDNAFLHTSSQHSGWIEIKETDVFPNKVKYRPRQALWLYLHSGAGGIALTIIHVKQIKQVIIIPGQFSCAAENDLKWLFLTPSRDPDLRLIDDHDFPAISDAILSICNHTKEQK